MFDSMHTAWTHPDVPIERLLADGFTPEHYRPDSATWRAADAEATRAFIATVQRWRELGSPARRNDPPRPSPEIRITPWA